MTECARPGWAHVYDAGLVCAAKREHELVGCLRDVSAGMPHARAPHARLERLGEWDERAAREGGMGAIKPILKALERLASLTGLARVARDERIDECAGRDGRVASLAHIPCVGGDDECVRMSTGKGSPGRGHATDACVGPSASSKSSSSRPGSALVLSPYSMRATVLGSGRMFLASLM